MQFVARFTVMDTVVIDTLPDGLDALREQIGLATIASIIERTARWVDPATFKLLPVWYPEHARGHAFFKTNWSAPLTNTKRTSGTVIHKVEGNIFANQALTLALGLRKINRPNWSCCHIWGVDDATFQASNAVVQDPKFYSCVANMVLLPTPLKAFTDSIPEVKTMLRLCARNLYNWHCNHASLSSVNIELDSFTDWSAYPASWPRLPGEKLPLGVMKLNPAIRSAAQARVKTIKHDMQNAGQYYPRDSIYDTLSYWWTDKDKSSMIPDPLEISDPRRFAATANDFTPLGKIIRTVDHLTHEERLENLRHDENLRRAFK